MHGVVVVCFTIHSGTKIAKAYIFTCVFVAGKVVVLRFTTHSGTEVANTYVFTYVVVIGKVS